MVPLRRDFVELHRGVGQALGAALYDVLLEPGDFRERILAPAADARPRKRGGFVGPGAVQGLEVEQPVGERPFEGDEVGGPWGKNAAIRARTLPRTSTANPWSEDRTPAPEGMFGNDRRWGKPEPDQMLKHRPDTTLAASKTVVRVSVPWVRIPPPPPPISHCYRTVFQDTAWIRTCPETSGAYARCAFPSWPTETGQVRPTGRSYRKSLLRRFWWYG